MQRQRRAVWLSRFNVLLFALSSLTLGVALWARLAWWQYLTDGVFIGFASWAVLLSYRTRDLAQAAQGSAPEQEAALKGDCGPALTMHRFPNFLPESTCAHCGRTVESLPFERRN